MSKEMNLGLSLLRGKDLGEIFTKVTLYDEHKEVAEIIVDAVNMLYLNGPAIKTSKTIIKKVVENFIEIYRNNVELFNKLLNKLLNNKAYPNSIEGMYETLCRNLLIISYIENTIDTTEGILLKEEICSKSNFIRLYYSFKSLSCVDCGMEEISKIVSDYLISKENNLESSLDDYLLTETKKFNLIGLHYRMKKEYKAQIYNQIFLNSTIIREEYHNASVDTISSILSALDTIADAYASTLAKYKIVDTLNGRKERIEDRTGYCVQPLSEIKSEYLENDEKILEVFRSF